MKRCSNCEIEKEFNSFGKRKASKDGLAYVCKECKKILDKKYQVTNKVKIKDYQEKYYRENILELKNKSADNYFQNKDYYKSYNKQKYQENKLEILDKQKKYYMDNRDNILQKMRCDYSNSKEKFIEKSKQYISNNKEKVKLKKKEYRRKNKEKIKEYKIKNSERYYEYNKTYGKSYRTKNKNILNLYFREYYNIRKYKRAWRSILSRYMKYIKSHKSKSTLLSLGYSYLDLKQRIECQFKSGMSWDNYGLWHIDHKKPLSSFNKETPANVVNMLSNLQPLWADENLKKGKKWQKK